VRQIAAGLALAWAAAAYPLYAAADPALVEAAAVGCVIAVSNAMAGCLSAVWAIDKPQAVFLKVLFGGTTARLLMMGVAFGLVVRLTDIHTVGLTFSLFGFYVVFQVLEVRFLVLRMKARYGGD
jgi:hypothetical protein